MRLTTNWPVDRRYQEALFDEWEDCFLLDYAREHFGADDCLYINLECFILQSTLVSSEGERRSIY